MQALLTHLTAFSLGIHALVGCCWHHAHECACQAGTQVVVADAETPKLAACCHHCHRLSDSPSDLTPGDCRSEDDQSSHPPAPCNCKVECHGVCTYLPPQKSLVDGFDDSAAFDLSPLAIDQSCAAATRAAYWEWPADSGDAAAPLRLHLLHQVFLI